MTPRPAGARPPRQGRARPAPPPTPADTPPPTDARGLLDAWWWPWAGVAVGLVVVLLTYRAYGSNWDEAVQAYYGELALGYFRSGLTDPRVNQFLDLRFYGPLVEMIPALLGADGSARGYELRHLVIPLFGLAALPALFAYAARARVPGLALLATLGLGTMPRFYGDWFNNSKDVPFACFLTLSMFTLAALFGGRPRGRWPVVACGVAFGLTLSVRPGGLPILALFFGVAAALWLLEGGVGDGRLRAVLLQGLGVFAIAWGLMVLPWPWAHENPLTHPVEAMRVAASFTSSYPVLFEGTTLASSAMPRRYLLEYLLITTPPWLLALAVVGVVTGPLRAGRAGSPSFHFLLTLSWVVLPLVLFALARPNVYDGIRHFLFVLPALAVLAAYGATGLAERLAGRRRELAVVACAGLLLLPVKDLVALHPYQTTYFNGLVGGVAGADGRFDTDYWLTTYREALGWVNEQAARRPRETVTVVVAGDGYIAPWVEAYAAANVRAQVVSTPPAEPALPAGVDYYVATKRWGLDRGYPSAPLVHTIGRAGAVFTVVKGRAATP